MEIIAKVSKGSKMDQIYIPRNRMGMAVGSYVVIRPAGEIERKEKSGRLYYYDVKELEPIKLEIVNRIFSVVERSVDELENIIITGSFLDEGYGFNDIDVLVVGNSEFNERELGKEIERETGMKTHFLSVSNSELANGLESDPFYQVMLSRCITKKRFVYKIGRKINYKILDLHLLHSKTLIEGFDVLNGIEKYKFTRNMIAIYLFVKGRKVGRKEVDKEIKKIFGTDPLNIKNDTLDKKNFLERYKGIYNRMFDLIMKGIKDGTKQK
jgi:hypothetical protein